MPGSPPGLLVFLIFFGFTFDFEGFGAGVCGFFNVSWFDIG